MLTVKHVSWDGTERVIESSVVGLQLEQLPGDKNFREVVACECGEGWCEKFSDGVVYVMNSNGKTVSVYRPQSREMPEI